MKRATQPAPSHPPSIGCPHPQRGFQACSSSRSLAPTAPPRPARPSSGCLGPLQGCCPPRPRSHRQPPGSRACRGRPRHRPASCSADPLGPRLQQASARPPPRPATGSRRRRPPAGCPARSQPGSTPTSLQTGAGRATAPRSLPNHHIRRHRSSSSSCAWQPLPLQAATPSCSCSRWALRRPRRRLLGARLGPPPPPPRSPGLCGRPARQC
jgi:hypothetical protein